MLLQYKALGSQKAKGIKVDFRHCDLKTKPSEGCLLESELVTHPAPLKTNHILAFISVTSCHVFVLSGASASGTVAGEDILVSVALLFLRVVQINMILCMSTCIKVLLEFLTAAYVIF